MTSRSTPVAAIAALAVAVLLSACASSTKPSHTPKPSTTHSTPLTVSPPPTTSSSAGSLPLKYAKCMRAHGLPTFPDPVDGHITLNPSSGISPDSPTFAAAAKVCAKYGPAGGASPGRGPVPAADGGGSNVAAVTQATWDQYANWLGQQATAGQFSGAVLVAHGDRTMLDAGYGFANRTTRTPNSPQTLFCIASIGKLFTAVAIGQLAEQHKLSFDAPVGRYVSGLPARIADHVTIGQLLDMTSGLDNVVLGRANPPRTLGGMVALIAAEPLQFSPGTKTLYSNDGFILLGAVVQRLSGERYSDYLRQHILNPAGMTHTGYATYTPEQVPGMAHGYALVGSRLEDISGQPQIANPSGGAYATTGDLHNLGRALLQHKLLSAAMTATILAPRVNAPQPGGPPVDEFTYGFVYQAINHVAFVGHNGGTPGYTDQIDIYPHGGYVVVILTNEDGTLVPAIQRSEQILTGS
ncbi:MAG: beta-lactamase family protein [Solirubrobacterales bacterium]|nr:beta-lactamase family protein [Solirubrobacterales bacterium]